MSEIELEDTIMKILSPHVGEPNALKRSELLHQLAAAGQVVDDRKAREAINRLRKHGALIASAGGVRGGYWICANPEELAEFIDHELRGRLFDYLQQERAMKRGGRRRWGTPRLPAQLSLFDPIALQPELLAEVPV